MNKIQIRFTDFLPISGKISIGQTDKNLLPLFVGDTISREDGERFVIGYRYGAIALIPFFGMHTLGTSDYKQFEKKDERTLIEGKFVIVGFDNEDFFTENSELLKGDVMSVVTPQ